MTETSIRCPLPGHTDNNPSASLNVEKGVWWCRVCNTGGKYASPQSAAAPGTPTAATALETSDALVQRGIEDLWGSGGREGRQYLFGRGFTEATLRRFGAGWYSDVGAVGLPGYAFGKLRDLQFRRLVPDDRGKYFFAAKPDTCLWGIDAALLAGDDAPLVVTEGRFDALSLYEIFPEGVAVVAAQSISQPLPPLFLPHLRRFCRAYVLYDAELKAVPSAEATVAALGGHRAVRVELPLQTKYKDVNELLRGEGADTARKLLEEAFGAARAGATPLLIRPTARLVLDAAEFSFTQYPLNDPALDGFLGGGLRGGELLALVGYSGYGKTTLALWLCHKFLRAGRRVVLCSFENSLGGSALPKLVSMQQGANLWLLEYAERARRVERYPFWDNLVCLNRRGVTPLADIEAGLMDAYKRGATLAILDHVQHFINAASDRGERVETIEAMKMLSRVRAACPKMALVVLVQPLKTAPEPCTKCGGAHLLLGLTSLKGASELYEIPDTVILIQHGCTGYNLTLGKARPETILEGPERGLDTGLVYRYDKRTAQFTFGEGP